MTDLNGFSDPLDRAILRAQSDDIRLQWFDASLGSTRDLVTLSKDGAMQVNGDLAVRGPIVDVRAFGAIGDGVTDDSDAIQAAIDSLPLSGPGGSTPGGTVFFPQGTYAIQKTLEVRGPDMRLIGAGARSTEILAVAPFTGQYMLEIDPRLGLGCAALAQMLVEAMKEQQRTIADLQQRLRTLEDELAATRGR